MSERELIIQSRDGNRRKIPLRVGRLTLGRSSENDLSYPDDQALSRRHLIFDFDGQICWIEDLKTTNGSQLNGSRLAGRQRLEENDAVSAGSLSLTFGTLTETEPDVTFVPDELSDSQGFEPRLAAPTTPERVEEIVKSPAISGTSRVQALLDAGREISGDRPIEELFQVILDLVVSAVGGSRAVILTNNAEGELVPRAMRGSGFRISSSVRDRIMIDKESILILDASRHEVLSSSSTIQRQRVKSLMAVPLQTQDRVIGLVYVDSQDQVRFFLHEDLTLLTLMANMAAIRIEQAQG